jgi:hypothetical protein
MDNEVVFKKMNKKYKECFIKECVLEGHIFWTYHVNMRLRERNISLECVIEALTCCSIINRGISRRYTFANLPCFGL